MISKVQKKASKQKKIKNHNERYRCLKPVVRYLAKSTVDFLPPTAN